MNEQGERVDRRNLPFTSKKICWLCLYLHQTSRLIRTNTIKAALKLAPKAIALRWLVPNPKFPEEKYPKKSKTCFNMLKVTNQTKINIQIQVIRPTPSRASGAKDSGSGRMAEQLFGPQIKGLPTILNQRNSTSGFEILLLD